MPAHSWETTDKTKHYDLSILNYENLEEAGKEYNNNEDWMKYAKLCGKNPFLKKIILDKYSNTCQFCHGEIKNNFVLHHLTYRHTCNMSIILIHSPTKKEPDRKIEVPDCKNCQNPCTDKLVPVHSFCVGLIKKTQKLMRRENNEL